MVNGLKWLSADWQTEREGFVLGCAGRTRWNEEIDELRRGYAKLFAEQYIHIDANDPERLVLFPEMDEEAAVPEITTACWDILGKTPDDIMCSTSRMVVKRKDAEAPTVLACTLIAYDDRFGWAKH